MSNWLPFFIYSPLIGHCASGHLFLLSLAVDLFVCCSHGFGTPSLMHTVCMSHCSLFVSECWKNPMQYAVHFLIWRLLCGMQQRQLSVQPFPGNSGDGEVARWTWSLVVLLYPNCLHHLPAKVSQGQSYFFPSCIEALSLYKATFCRKESVW